ncbi:hypothetical protein CGLO_08062 [Colletotrichum gloeosporioides Cg-14]|uniref:NUDIX domain-containing protein n=1 Tax=Colletotrichum gloeosporioides (strain Cg-14) TaxID=1237896 RepID=T0KHB4_COLGC|nr:hypothetical protein CGLO_08062 [Colletotrichum gloeosporioides Cg-14]
MPPLNLSRVSEMLERLQNTLEEESQQAGPRWLIKTYDDLTPEEKSIPDDWLPRLHHCNRMGTLDSLEKKEAARQKIWALVFDGWDTDSPIPKPTNPGGSKATDGIVKIGVLDEDAPSSRKRKADGSMAPVPAWRSRGADVFIKAKAHWRRQDLCFPLCDSRGIAFASNISYRKLPGSSLGRLKGECSSRWDSIEVYRGRKANNELVAYWARNKLMVSLKNNWRGRGDPDAVGLPGSRTTATLPGRSTMEIDQIIDLGKLTYIKLCMDIWEANHDAASFHMAMKNTYSGVFEMFELVKDVNRFQIKGTEWKFCLKDPTNPTSPWKAFGIVLEENVKWLKKANSKWLDFDWLSKQIRLINPPIDPKTGIIQLNYAWKEIIDKLDEIPGDNLPQWVKKDTKWLYNDQESWPLIEEHENFRKLFSEGIWCDLVPIFGILTTGAHLNVYKITKEKGFQVWVSQRPDTQPNFPGLLDQAAAGGFTPSHKTILECIEREKKQESKGYPRHWRDLMRQSPNIPTIQYFDVRDERWEKGYAGLPEPGIRKAYDLRVNDEKIKGKEGQTFKLMGIDEVRESLLHGRWKPNSALVMIDFMIRHGLIENKIEKAEIPRLLKLDRERQFGFGIAVIELSDYVQFPLHGNK